MSVAPLASIPAVTFAGDVLTPDQRAVFDRYVARETTWGNVLAGAVVSRMAIETTTDPTVVVPAVAVPRLAAKAWTDAEKDTVHDLAIARVQQVFDMIEDSLGPRIEAICLAREELEAVASLLAAAGALGRLRGVLSLLDEAGLNLSFTFQRVNGRDTDAALASGARLLGSSRWWTRHIYQ